MISTKNIKKIRRPKIIDGFKVPVWWECGWRRKNCKKRSCVLCGGIIADREKHIAKGEDPDSMKSVLEDVGQSLVETLVMIKVDAEKHGIDITNIEDIKEPPKPESHALYRNIAKWRNGIIKLVDKADEADEIWISTEPAADLLWYISTLSAKTYRQLCNRWHIKNGDGYGEFDYKYTQYVLSEVLDILENSLAQLTKLNSQHQVVLMFALNQLIKFRKSILSI